MILSDSEIKMHVEKGNIKIEPWNDLSLGSNSYDVHLSKYLAIYKESILDSKKENSLLRFGIPKGGYVLEPGKLYLGSTVEYTETHLHVPMLDGKSSTGRLGIDIHATAGVGDVGFCNHWTLELSVKQPVRIYAGMPIGQLTYHKVQGRVNKAYNCKKGAKYTTVSKLPQASQMYKNKFLDE